MPYAIEFRPTAHKELASLPARDRLCVAREIEKLSFSPRPPGSQKLKGMDQLYRVRVGDYRIIYQIQDDRLLVLVVRIGHRREVYR